MATISVAALWQIAYAPYVSDYTRYMPKDTGVRAAFWATYAGCVLGSTCPCCSVPSSARLAELGHSRRDGDADPASPGCVFIIFAVGVAATNSMDLYCGSLSTITIGQNLVHGGNPPPSAVPSQLSSCSVSPRSPTLLSAENFLANYAQLPCPAAVRVDPWTAVNLVDYYFLRHGEYDIPSLFERDGGEWNLQLDCDCLLLPRHPHPDPVPVDPIFTGFAAEPSTASTSRGSSASR